MQMRADQPAVQRDYIRHSKRRNLHAINQVCRRSVASATAFWISARTTAVERWVVPI